MNFGLWLRDELDTEAAARRGEEQGGSGRRRIQLSDLEALALLILCVERQGQPGPETYTSDLARRLAAALVARLQA